MENFVTIDNKKYKIYRFIDESDTIYNFRYNYINNNIDTDTLKRLVINSKIIANIKFKGCKYEPKIFNSFKSFINPKD